MQPIVSDFQVKCKIIDDLATTISTLELAKEQLIENDYNAARRMLQICQSDLQQNERRLRALAGRKIS